MKGTIINGLEELVTQKFGTKQWEASLKIAGIPESRVYGTFEDVPDSEMLSLFNAVSEAVDLPLDEVIDAFGEYWSTVYAPRVYAAYYVGAKNARDLLLRMDDIHMAMTKTLKSARPPRFRYEWRGDKHLIMHYQSARGLVALMAGLVRGVGKYYKEQLGIRIAGNAVHIRFL
ncbi:MAG TPA: heme NO-binding domain-containing protein [Candidatus Acidoferrales bacterium]|nr:heme NO-binding domain-containing protein [Candidatus Acidoferrales bacterium]